MKKMPFLQNMADSIWLLLY